MINFVNDEFIKISTNSKPSKNGDTVWYYDIMPISASENQKPICRVYSREELMNPLVTYQMSCTNTKNTVHNSINTTFDVIIDDTTDNAGEYYVIAIPFNGILTNITIDKNLTVLNGCFAKVTPFTLESEDDKHPIKYSKIAYFVVQRDVDAEKYTITLVTSSVSVSKQNENERTKSIYTNTFEFPRDPYAMDEENTEKCICLSSKKNGTEPVDDNYTAPKFSTLINPRVDKEFNPNAKNNKKGSNNTNIKFNNIRMKDDNGNRPNTNKSKKSINKLNANKKKFFD